MEQEIRNLCNKLKLAMIVILFNFFATLFFPFQMSLWELLRKSIRISHISLCLVCEDVQAAIKAFQFSIESSRMGRDVCCFVSYYFIIYRISNNNKTKRNQSKYAGWREGEKKVKPINFFNIEPLFLISLGLMLKNESYLRYVHVPKKERGKLLWAEILCVVRYGCGLLEFYGFPCFKR